MRIVYSSLAHLPGETANSVHIARMCDAFTSLGHEVTLVAAHSSEPTTVREFYGLDGDFDTVSLDPWDGVRGWSHVAAAKTALIARRRKADFVYGRFAWGCALSGMAAVPFAVEFHTPPPTGSFGRRVRWESVRRHPLLRAMVAITESLKRDLHALGASGRVLVEPDAASPPGSAPPLRLEGRTRIGYVGQLYPGKGMDLIARLVRRMPECDFHVAGGPEDLVRHWSGVLADCPNAHFHGFIAPHQTDRFRRGCDLLLAPYSAKVEGCDGKQIGRWMSPLKLFEYMASGVPFLTSDLPVLREVLYGPLETALCDPTSPADWERKARLLLTDPERSAALTAHARARAKAHTWAARAQRILEFCQLSE
ncbi:MAG TPA: glycosyltransferase family 4 protein [Polyangiaceae bacterium LLY-WYZ-15_(1-7)]|nr:hypothetical protein [Sandaracinus sp.]HJK90343.1 glycosyltransferase family 4 protein [Polyangiaceae bacterium LLY-WYZ-15_(1-7)]MBJ75268.1 hypothetical protein [Sandaracinus sp.]HJL06158.1 glycosyltransferase family 4 protein [Polyangiaceae bacterium LLY-WYZ-15_(1-7)]HJL11793.1 glycosyltransferase family 4 protein [Polyangiaceae bacterium LLY-WYZ-15_(1-7)]